MILGPNIPIVILVIAVSLWAAVRDYQTGLIPNRLVLIGAVSILLVRMGTAYVLPGSGRVSTSLLVGLLGAVAVGLVPLTLYWFRGIGAGDVKLLTVVGLGLGPSLGLEAELYAFGLGSLFALGRAAFEGTLWQTLRGSAVLLTNPMIARWAQKPVPQSALRPIVFGPAIFGGALAATLLHALGL